MRLNELFENKHMAYTGNLEYFHKDQFLGVEELTISNCHNLKSLVGLPKEVYILNIKNNIALRDLVGCPDKVGEDMFVEGNGLISLKGIPKHVQSLTIRAEHLLRDDLDFLPEIIDEYFVMRNCSIHSLSGIHKKIKTFGNNVQFGTIRCIQMEVPTHLLGLLKIPKLKQVYFEKEDLTEIINKYLPLGDIFDCQEELIEAGFEEYAQL